MGLKGIVKKVAGNPLVSAALPMAAPVLGLLGGGGTVHAADGMRADEAAAQAAINARIASLRASYGEGDGPEAESARAGIERYIGQLSGESEGAAIAEAGDILQAATRSSEDALYSQGLAGGSADLETRRQILGEFVKNRQRIASATKSAGDQTRAALRQERLGMEREIAQGTRADPTWNATAGTRQAQLSSAWQRAWQDQLGVLADGAGAGIAASIRPRTSPIDRMQQRQQANVDTFNAAAREL